MPRRCWSPPAAHPNHSPSHVGLDPVWAAASEAGIPVVFHVGGTGDLIDPAYFRNGLPVPPDFHGGEENFRSVDYMGIPGPPAQTLATLIFDGVLERFPDLRIGVIEQGAIWVPSWLRQMEAAFEAFARHEERLQGLSLRPTEYVRRQVRFTPYPTEDVGWIIAQAGPEVCLFSSDYPHVEGGRRPIERFEASLAGISEHGAAGLLPRQLRGPDGGRPDAGGLIGSTAPARRTSPGGRARRRPFDPAPRPTFPLLAERGARPGRRSASSAAVAAATHDLAEPGLGRRHVEQRGGLGDPRVTSREGRQDAGVLGDGPLLGARLDDTSPHPSAARAARHAVQHRGEGLVAGRGGDELVELGVELHQLVLRRGLRHLM